MTFSFPHFELKNELLYQRFAVSSIDSGAVAVGAIVGIRGVGFSPDRDTVTVIVGRSSTPQYTFWTRPEYMKVRG